MIEVYHLTYYDIMEIKEILALRAGFFLDKYITRLLLRDKQVSDYYYNRLDRTTEILAKLEN